MKKLFFNRLLTTVFALAFLSSVFAQEKLPQFGKNSINEIIEKMTIEDKVKMVVGKGISIRLNLSLNDSTPDKLNGIAGYTIPIPKFGIPSIAMADGPSGVHRLVMSKKDSVDNLFSTAWPVGTLLASSWDTDLIKKVGIAFGQEIKDYGIDLILAPGANIHRNPLGGRNFEYYSEDPLISGSAAAAIINGIQSNGVGATIKHYAANNQETNRNTLNEIISQRALREIYLRSFEIAIKKSQPWAVMSSYNKINGASASESHDLITKVLRHDWGFKGFVMTDWFAGNDPIAQMNAGNNLLMPGTPEQIKAIVEAVKNGQLSEKALNKNVEDILNVFIRTPTAKKYAYPNKVDLKAHAEIARQAAAESMVLLKNNNKTLPIRNNKTTIALFGNHGYDLIAGGTGSGNVNKAYAISLAEGLTTSGYKLNHELAKTYHEYIADYKAKHPKKTLLQEFKNPTPIAAEYEFDANSIKQKAETSDLAVIYIGRNAGEARDRKIADDYELTNQEKNMIAHISDAFHAKNKPVVAVLNIGGVINVTSFRDQVDAILLAWQPGQEGGNAIADILSGKVNPSGKLATTFSASYAQEPSAINFPGKEFPEKAIITSDSDLGLSVPAEVSYQEGIYIGYRYYNTFKIKPAYEFGYGLSYTNFTYSKLALGSQIFKDKLNVSVTITNTGPVAGKEVVELYLSAPRKTMDKPSEELKAFGKTKLLQPGESQILTFTLNPEDLASFDTNQSAWIAEEGKYHVKIGASSNNIKLSKPFDLAKTLTVQKVSRALTPQTTINDLKSN